MSLIIQDYGSMNRVTEKAPMYPFSTATEEQLTKMLQSYYAGLYDATDLIALKTIYMPVGATRSIHISAMSATGVSESHHADNYEVVIIGQEHDNLTTPSSGEKTKALLTLNLVRMLYKNTTDDTYSGSSVSDMEEAGYMNPTGTNAGGWKDCARRTWCNDVFYNALPNYIKNCIRNVDKIYYENSVAKTTSDKVFLLSTRELNNTSDAEGNQYSYFTTSANKNKRPYYTGSTSGSYWLRSMSSTNSFAKWRQSSEIDASTANVTLGIVPTFCL